MKPPSLLDLVRARLGPPGPKHAASLPPGWRVIVGGLSPENRDLFEERAAIREFEGNVSREDAEAAAYAEVTAPCAPNDDDEGAP